MSGRRVVCPPRLPSDMHAIHGWDAVHARHEQPRMPAGKSSGQCVASPEPGKGTSRWSGKRGGKSKSSGATRAARKAQSALEIASAQVFRCMCIPRDKTRSHHSQRLTKLTRQATPHLCPSEDITSHQSPRPSRYLHVDLPSPSDATRTSLAFLKCFPSWPALRPPLPHRRPQFNARFCTVVKTAHSLLCLDPPPHCTTLHCASTPIVVPIALAPHGLPPLPACYSVPPAKIHTAHLQAWLTSQPPLSTNTTPIRTGPPTLARPELPPITTTTPTTTSTTGAL